MTNCYLLRRHGLLLLLTGLFCISLLDGCANASALFYVNRNGQAIQHDTITTAGIKSTLQNPQDAVEWDDKTGSGREARSGTGDDFASIGTGDLAVRQASHADASPGFTASVYAYDLGSPSDLVLRDDGTIFYSDINTGEVAAIAADGSRTIIAEGLKTPFGMEFHDGALYYTDERNVYRFDFSSPTAVTGTITLLSDKLPDVGTNDTRTIRWVPADKKFYISVGSTSNKNPEDDNSHAAILRMADKKGDLPVTAIRGVRNTVAMDVHPETGEIWGIDNGTDYISVDLPPEEINILKVGRHYGWPYFYSQNFRDPEYMTEDTAKYLKSFGQTTPPTIELAPHLEVMDMQFYTGSALGSDWKNAIVATCYGERSVVSSNEGLKVIRIRADANGANARQADFVTGFKTETGEIWGRPVGIAIGKDGKSFFISDDRAGVIYKIVKQ